MRMSNLRVTAVAAFIGLGAIAGSAALSAGEADASWAHPGRGDLITFDVYSDTTWATVSYINGGNILRQQHFNFRPDERLADGRYHRQFAFRSAVPNQILAVKIQQEGLQASCKLFVNRKLKVERTAHGERAAAQCGVRGADAPHSLS